jgi:hypothetical protein
MAQGNSWLEYFVRQPQSRLCIASEDPGVYFGGLRTKSRHAPPTNAERLVNIVLGIITPNLEYYCQEFSVWLK